MTKKKKTEARGKHEDQTEDAATTPEHDASDNGDNGEASAEAPAPEASPPEPSPPEPSPEETIGKLKDQLLRSMAETENLRARSDREREDTRKYAVSNFARDMLAVADNLRRAIDSVTDEMRADPAAKLVIAGIEMTERHLLQTFEKHGIRVINPVDGRFDHNFHQAMFEVESTHHEPGAVVEVLQIGYAIHDRLLRPAMVGVAKKPKASDQKPGDGIDTVA